MFSKIRALLDYASQYPELAERRKKQLTVESEIDQKIKVCSKETQLNYYRKLRELNRCLSATGYSIDLSETPNHVLNTFQITEQIQAIMQQPGCVCENARQATSLASDQINSYSTTVE